MWKLFFDFMDFMARLIPFRKLRNHVRDVTLFGYGAKKRALKTARPELDWRHMRLCKGGGSLAFVLNNEYVFKVRKRYDREKSLARFMREKRITDAVAPLISVAVPHIEIQEYGGYVFYITKFIHGRILIDLPLHKLREYHDQIGAQLGEIIYTVFNAKYPQLKDFKPKNTGNDCGLVHGDLCSNMLIDPATMKIVGIIDWEWAGFGSLRQEFIGIFRVRRKMRLTDIAPSAMWTYFQLDKKNRKKS